MRFLTLWEVFFSTEILRYQFDEVPNGRLQPFVVENTHIQTLVSVSLGNILDTGVRFDTFVGNKRNPDANGNQIQCGMSAPQPRLKRIQMSTGPVDIVALQQMAQAGQLTAASLVWKAGMAGWKKIGTVGELNEVFAQIPSVTPAL